MKPHLIACLMLGAGFGCGKVPIQGAADAGADPTCTWFRDADQDGFGDPADSLDRCDQPAGYVDNDLDCDDGDRDIHPETQWHPDADGDGYGDAATSVEQCVRPADHLLDDRDCDDGDPAVNPETIWYADDDMDGFGDSADTLAQCAQPPGYVIQGGDCDDTNQMIKPGTVWHPDADGDGYGDASMMQVQCAQPSGYVLDGTDCDDSDPDQHPGQTWHLDFDMDGFGHPGVTMTACATPPMHVLDGRDCDDMDIDVYPGRGTCPFTPPMATSCLDVLTDGNSEGDGAYLVDPDAGGPAAPMTVFCDMTTDGGGWTALLNPMGMPTSTIPGLSISWTHVSGAGSSCAGNPYVGSSGGWYGYSASDCDTYTNAYTVDWPNAFGASDVMFNATLQGETTNSLTIDGVTIAPDATSSDGRCALFSATGAGLPAGIPTYSCYGYWVTAPPVVHPGSFAGALTMVVTVGPGCDMFGCYGLGFNLHHLFVR